MDSGLTSEQIDHFKQMLLERQAELKALDWSGSQKVNMAGAPNAASQSRSNASKSIPQPLCASAAPTDSIQSS